MKLPLAVVVALGACSCVSLHGDSFETLERSTQFVSTATAPRGVVEVELSGDWNPGDELNTLLSLRYGATETTEVFLELEPYKRVASSGTDARGVSDFLLGTTSRFREEDEHGPALALTVSAKLPLGSDDEDLSTGEPDGLAGLIASAHCGPGVASAAYELAFSGQSDGSGVDVQHAGGWYYALPLRAGGAGFIGLEGSWSGELQHVQSAGLAGLAFGLSTRLVFDLGVRTRLSGEGPTGATLVAGLTLAY